MNEFSSALIGAGAGAVGSKAAEKFIKRYGLVLTGLTVFAIWYSHKKVSEAQHGR